MARSWITTTSLVLGAAGALAACSRRPEGTETASRPGTASTDTSATAAVPPPDAAVVDLAVAAVPGVGVFLIGPAGHPVYLVHDSSGTPDSNTWQPVTGRAAPAKGDTAVKASLIGTKPGPGGTQQATYNGQRLYYYRGDSTAKDIKGQGHKENGATSYLVSPNGKAITGTAK
jgi:hypothetical protein